MKSVTAIGELLIDFACIATDADGYPQMMAHPGGAPANLLAALNTFGIRTSLLGKVGDDAFGRLLINTLKKSGINTSGILVDDSVFTTLAFVTFDERGEREFSFARKPGADTQLRFEELSLSLIDEADVLHFGTLSLTDEPSREATHRAVEYARGRGKQISFDPNLRKPLWRVMDEAAEQMKWGLKQADVVKISDEEVDFLWGITPEEGAEKLIGEYGVRLVFVTCGAEGCFYKNRNAAGRMPALAGIKAVDTTGAGDIFGGSALSVLLKSGKVPDELNDGELREMALFACTAAGLSTTSLGGISSIPSAEAVNEKMRSLTL